MVRLLWPVLAVTSTISNRKSLAPLGVYAA